LNSLPHDFFSHATTPAGYLRAAREVAAHPEWFPIRRGVALLSSFSANFLIPYLTVEAAKRNLGLNITHPGFNQIEAELLAPTSATWRSQPELFLILLLPFDATSTTFVERLRALCQGIRAKSTAPIVISNFFNTPDALAGLANPLAASRERAAIEEANRALTQLHNEFAGLSVFDLAASVETHGHRTMFDTKLEFYARIPFSAQGQQFLGAALARHVRAIFSPPAKCAVLDLDNTLWGGVLGEDGPGGIKLGEDFPGNIFKAFQRHLLALREAGVLLALASKNNEEEVRAVFLQHPDMVLRWEHFSATRINWQHKSVSLREIAAELNLGADSLVFLDDNPAEREEVRRNAPEVRVLDLPADPLAYESALTACDWFDRLDFSQDDSVRADQYQAQNARTQAQHAAPSLDAYLENLAMVATVGFIDAETLSRASQLIAKTNQFNLTTRRHSAPEIEALVQSGFGLWLRLQDRFGDNGLTALAIAVPEKDALWRIDTFLLSCRIIGRSAETALLHCVLREIAKRGGQTVLGEFIVTGRNSICADFYARHGFGAENETLWRLDLARSTVQFPPFIFLAQP